MDLRDSGQRPQGEPTRDLTASLAAVHDGSLTRRAFVARAAALGLSVSAAGALLAACGGGKKSASAKPVAIDTTKPSQIVVYNWQYYMSPKAIRSFEQSTGIKVVEKFFDDPTQIPGQLEAGESYDVIFPADTTATQLIEDALVQPLDMALIPNFATYVAGSEFASPPYDPGTDGVKYTVPYMFGTTGFAARLDQVAEPGSSWKQLWDAKYKGDIEMLTGRDALSASLFALSLPPNTTSQADLDKATDYLIEQKPLVAKYDDTYPTGSIIKGRALTMCWDGDAIGAINKVGLNKVRYVLPDEGYIIWADALCIPKTAKSAYGAHLFLNHLLDPKVAAECADYIGYQPAVPAADPLVKSLVQRAMRPTPEVLAKGVYAAYLGDFQAQYEAAWKKVMSA
jgi:spermidine/putrescine transport system substrate-binding protein